MAEAAKGEVYDFGFPFGNYWAIRNINFSEIGRMYVFLTGVSSGNSAEVHFSRLEALREKRLPVQNPKITVNGQTMVFPSRLDTDCYLEYSGHGRARIFDANGFTKAEVRPTGAPPIVRKGANTLKVQNDGFASSKVTVMTYGRSLR